MVSSLAPGFSIYLYCVFLSLNKVIIKLTHSQEMSRIIQLFCCIYFDSVILVQIFFISRGFESARGGENRAAICVIAISRCSKDQASVGLVLRQDGIWTSLNFVLLEALLLILYLECLLLWLILLAFFLVFKLLRESRAEFITNFYTKSFYLLLIHPLNIIIIILSSNNNNEYCSYLKSGGSCYVNQPTQHHIELRKEKEKEKKKSKSKSKILTAPAVYYPRDQSVIGAFVRSRDYILSLAIRISYIKKDKNFQGSI